MCCIIMCVIVSIKHHPQQTEKQSSAVPVSSPVRKNKTAVSSSEQRAKQVSAAFFQYSNQPLSQLQLSSAYIFSCISIRLIIA